MANPQVEDGHTRIAHEVLEAFIRTALNGSEFRVLLAIVRKTWGWHKKEDTISFSQIAEITGLPRRTVIRAANHLLAMKVLLKRSIAGKPSVWKVNKDYEQWEVVSKVALVSKVASVKSGIGTSDKNGLGVVSKVAPTKETLKRKRKKAASSDADPRFQPLKKFFHEQYEEIRGTKLDTNVSDYKALSDLLKRQPKLSLEDLQRAGVRYLKNDEPFYVNQAHPLRYWANNINPFLPGRKQWAEDLKEVN